jgi:hypothetical protein
MLITSSIYVVITGKICVGIDGGRPLQQSTISRTTIEIFCEAVVLAFWRRAKQPPLSKGLNYSFFTKAVKMPTCKNQIKKQKSP